jgi:hypothetical protein
LGIVFGILLLVAGAAYPMVAMVWLNRRLNRQPALTPRQLGLILAFNGVLPVSLVFWGVGMAVPRLWAVLAVRMVAVISSLAALVLFRMVWANRRGTPAQHLPDPREGDANGG